MLRHSKSKKVATEILSDCIGFYASTYPWNKFKGILIRCHSLCSYVHLFLLVDSRWSMNEKIGYFFTGQLLFFLLNIAIAIMLLTAILKQRARVIILK